VIDNQKLSQLQALYMSLNAPERTAFINLLDGIERARRRVEKLDSELTSATRHLRCQDRVRLDQVS